MTIPSQDHREPAAATQEWERTYAMWIHRGSLITCVLAVCTVGIAFWGPSLLCFCMWLGKREKSAFIDDQGRESLNFANSLVIYCGIALALGFITLGVAWILFGPIIALLTVVGLTKGAKAAARGELYRFPMCIRLL